MTADPPIRVTLGDHQLMLRMQGGSLDALGTIYDRYRDRAFIVARAVSVDAIRAEEAVQEGFVSIWNSRASYRPQAATAAPWLLTVVRHRAIDITRRDATDEARRVGEALLEDRGSDDDVAGEAVARADARDLQRQLASLPESQREVIFLAFYGELTHVEIAERLALPVGTVKGRMRLGLHKLRHQIGQQAARGGPPRPTRPSARPPRSGAAASSAGAGP